MSSEIFREICNLCGEPGHSREHCTKNQQNFETPEQEKVHVEIFQKVPYPEYWTEELYKQALEAEREFNEQKRKETPIYKLDLRDIGLGKNVLIKDEGDIRHNPTGTHKDRLARLRVEAHMQEVRRQRERKPEVSIESLLIPRDSTITMGNMGRALANAFEQTGQAPAKLLLDVNTSPKILDELRGSWADIYLTDLSKKALSSEEILTATENPHGKDLTDAYGDEFILEWARYYRELAEDVIKKEPQFIYTPFGTGMLFNNIVDRVAEKIDALNSGIAYEKDRFTTGLGLVDSAAKTFNYKSEQDMLRDMRVRAAGAKEYPSKADKLATAHSPFMGGHAANLEYHKHFFNMHKGTGIVDLTEAELSKGWSTMTDIRKRIFLNSEPSAASGLALYIKDLQEGVVSRDTKVLIVNTGKGVPNKRPKG